MRISEFTAGQAGILNAVGRVRPAADNQYITRHRKNQMKSLDEAFSQACGRFSGENFIQLEDPDKILVTIWGLEAEVNNGGFNQYYFNGSGDQAYYASDALQSIGAHKMASIVSSVNDVFGPDGPSRDRGVRQKQLILVAPNDGVQSPWGALDRAFQCYPDDIASLLIAYLRVADS